MCVWVIYNCGTFVETMNIGTVLLSKLQALIGFVLALKINKYVLKPPNKANK